MFARIFHELVYFTFKQAYACLFGGALLFGIVATKFFWPQDFALARYDFLFAYAILIQIALIAFKLESWQEVKVILLFHIVGTVMEIFKTSVGSWSYPEDNLIRFGGVPLFSGFMYSAVGSYIARAWRIFQFEFTGYPRFAWTLVLCVAIYINFFSHHYIPDVRIILFLCTALLFWRTKIYFKPDGTYLWMPLLLGWSLVALFIWVAENVGTFGNIWLYPSQKDGWHLVPIEKMGSWLLLMIISFVLVTLVHRKDKSLIDKVQPERLGLNKKEEKTPCL